MEAHTDRFAPKTVLKHLPKTFTNTRKTSTPPKSRRGACHEYNNNLNL